MSRLRTERKSSKYSKTQKLAKLRKLKEKTFCWSILLKVE
jgi:hypothetical protein